MPTGYMIEVSPNNRAGCQATHCKEEKVKIHKGELRLGSWVEIMEHGAWKYKHWGCVTPQQIQNVNKYLGDDMDIFEGFNELPDEQREKVLRALKNGHIDDEDWVGDVEYNRPGMHGYKKRTPKKNPASEDEDMVSEADTPVKPKSKKRGRPKENDDIEEEGSRAPKAAKKSKAATKLVKDGDDAAADEAPKKRAKQGKKSKTREVDEEVEAPAPKRKARMSRVKAQEASDKESEESEEPMPAPKRKSHAKKPKTQPAEESSKQVENGAIAEPSEAALEAAPAKKRGRPKKTTSAVTATKADDGEAEPKTAKRGRGRPRKNA